MTVKISELAGWREIPVAGVAFRPATESKTGGWRTLRPVVDEEKCTGCTLCHFYCPDGAMVMVDGKAKVDYDFCKGCGICAAECPAKAIEMVEER